MTERNRAAVIVGSNLEGRYAPIVPFPWDQPRPEGKKRPCIGAGRALAFAGKTVRMNMR
jgi:hypothetical protein